MTMLGSNTSVNLGLRLGLAFFVFGMAACDESDAKDSQQAKVDASKPADPPVEPPAETPATPAAPTGGSTVDDDERVVLFTTYASLDGAQWRARLHGWIHEPESSSIKRAAALKTLAAVLGVEDADEGVFERRAAWFLVDNEDDHDMKVSAGGTVVELESGDNGHFEGTAGFARATPTKPEVIGTRSQDSEDGRSFTGKLVLVPPTGVSVISDIDDTVKITEVTDKSKLVENTFEKEFREAPGMPALFQAWAAQGVAFHYVSSSPWQLFPELHDFMERVGLPEGSYHLKLFRVWDDSFFDLFKKGTETKPAAIAPILADFPGRSFRLVGDSGEQDPEIYGKVFRDNPGRIEHIYIRNVTGDTRAGERMVAAMQGVPADKWTLFDEPSAITR